MTTALESLTPAQFKALPMAANLNAALADTTLTRIRSIMGAAGPRRHLTKPWLVPDDYQANFAYGRGQRVKNAGNVYVSVQSGATTTTGTTGASSPPVHTTPAPVADGTVNWLYMGPLDYANDPFAPTFTLSTTAPVTPAKSYQNAAATLATGATSVIRNNEWYRALGHIPTDNTNGLDTGASEQSRGRIMFDTDERVLTLAIAVTNPGTGFNIVIDGRYLQDTQYCYPGGGGGTLYMTVTFPKKKNWRIATSFDWVNSNGIRYITTGADSACWAPRGERFGAKVLVYTDSFGNEFIQSRDAGAFSQICWADLGFEDVFNQSVSGTSLYHATNPYGSAARLAWLTAFQPDIVHVCSSINSSGTSQANVTATVSQFLTDARTALGAKGATAYFIFTGIWGDGLDGVESNNDLWLRTAITALNDPRVIWVPFATAVAGSGFFGSSSTGSGQWYITSAHPNQRGGEYAGHRMGAKLGEVLSALVTVP